VKHFALSKVSMPETMKEKKVIHVQTYNNQQVLGICGTTLASFK